MSRCVCMYLCVYVIHRHTPIYTPNHKQYILPDPRNGPAYLY